MKKTKQNQIPKQAKPKQKYLTTFMSCQPPACFFNKSQNTKIHNFV